MIHLLVGNFTGSGNDSANCRWYSAGNSNSWAVVIILSWYICRRTLFRVSFTSRWVIVYSLSPTQKKEAYHKSHPTTTWHYSEPTQSPISHGPEVNPAVTWIGWPRWPVASSAVDQRTCPTWRLKSRLVPEPKAEVKHFSRGLNNERIDLEICFLLSVTYLLESLAHRPPFLVMDGSTIGRGGLPSIKGICRKWALHLTWLEANCALDSHGGPGRLSNRRRIRWQPTAKNHRYHLSLARRLSYDPKYPIERCTMYFYPGQIAPQ